MAGIAIFIMGLSLGLFLGVIVTCLWVVIKPEKHEVNP